MNSENIGFLQIAVKTADGALPVPDAQVSIYDHSQSENGDGGGIIFSLVTDENGNTPKVALGAVNKKLSLVPGNSTPYESYTVAVSKDGFYDADFIKVPIFEGITSIQPVFLIPLLEYARHDDDYPISNRRNEQTPDTAL